MTGPQHTNKVGILFFLPACRLSLPGPNLQGKARGSLGATADDEDARSIRQKNPHLIGLGMLVMLVPLFCAPRPKGRWAQTKPSQAKQFSCKDGFVRQLDSEYAPQLGHSRGGPQQPHAIGKEKRARSMN